MLPRAALNAIYWVACAAVAWMSTSRPAISQEDCENTAEGRICKIRQEIRAGVVVSADLQKRLGLIHINGFSCSGTLLNRFWVLTARHCVTVFPSGASAPAAIASPLMARENIAITADWAPGRIGRPSMLRDISVNVGAGVTPTRDIILLYLGFEDLGAVDSQRIYVTVVEGAGGSSRLSTLLTTSDTVTQYGQGFDTFATGVIGGTLSAQPAQGIGVYRSSQFTPSSIIPDPTLPLTTDFYSLNMNSTSQVGHGGDSGGPTVVTRNNVGVGIAGVQSTCSSTGYVPGAPSIWMWSTGISACQYVSTGPFLDEIRKAITKTPGCNISLADCITPVIPVYLEGS